MANKPLIWHQRSFFSSLFPLLYLIFASNPLKFQNINSFFSLQIQSMFFLLLFILFEVIYNIRFFFNFIILQSFSFVIFGPYYFNYYLFSLRSFLKLNFFHNFIIFQKHFLLNLKLILLIAIFFTLIYFLNFILQH
jgi:hypothetical protein